MVWVDSTALLLVLISDEICTASFVPRTLFEQVHGCTALDLTGLVPILEMESKEAVSMPRTLDSNIKLQCSRGIE